MGVGRWTVLDYQAEVAWLAEDPQGHVTGFDVGGWPASVWLLNTIYELDAVGAVPTWDDVYREQLRRGLAEPDPIEAVLAARTTATGIGLGYEPRPDDARWRRVRWSELAERFGEPFGDQPYPPCHRWFPFRSWPASILAPTEGSLDEITLDALVAHLVGHSGSDACIASYGVVAAGMRDEAERCFTGPVTHLLDLVGDHRAGTASNVWGVDRSWMVWTDWDLLATKVSGTAALIADLEADPHLETLAWP